MQTVKTVLGSLIGKQGCETETSTLCDRGGYCINFTLFQSILGKSPPWIHTNKKKTLYKLSSNELKLHLHIVSARKSDYRQNKMLSYTKFVSISAIPWFRVNNDFQNRILWKCWIFYAWDQINSLQPSNNIKLWKALCISF